MDCQHSEAHLECARCQKGICENCLRQSPLGTICRSCNGEGGELLPSSRTRKRFTSGVIGGALLAFLTPLVIPGGLIVSAVLTNRWKLLEARRYLLATCFFLSFWIVLVPLVEKRIAGEYNFLGGSLLLFTSLILIKLFFRPGQVLASQLVFRGRGMLAGFTIVFAALASLFSFLAGPLLWFA